MESPQLKRIPSTEAPSNCHRGQDRSPTESEVQKKATRSRNKLPGASRQLPEDGHHWLKYGHKNILANSFSRAYYRCAQKIEGCQARKTVDFPLKNQGDLCITYDGEHNHSAATCPIDPRNVVVRHKQQGEEASPGQAGMIHHQGKPEDSSSPEILPGGSLPKWKVPPPPCSASSGLTTSPAGGHLQGVPSWEASSACGGPTTPAPEGLNWGESWASLRPQPSTYGPLAAGHAGLSLSLEVPFSYALGVRHMPWSTSQPSAMELHGSHFLPWEAPATPHLPGVTHHTPEVPAAEDSLSGQGSTEASSPGAVIRPIASRPGGLHHSLTSNSNIVHVSPPATVLPSGSKRVAAVSSLPGDYRPLKRVLVSVAGRGDEKGLEMQGQVDMLRLSGVEEGFLLRRDSLHPHNVPLSLTEPSDSDSSCSVLDLTLRL